MVSDGAVFTVVSLGLTPFVEVIGAVPAGLALHMQPFEAALWSVTGNIVEIIVLLTLLEQPHQRVLVVQPSIHLLGVIQTHPPTYRVGVRHIL